MLATARLSDTRTRKVEVPGPLVLTLVEDVHTRLVSTDDFQDFGITGQDPYNVPVMFQQFLCCLQLRDACWYHQSFLDFRLGGPVKGGVINLCEDRGTQLESPAWWLPRTLLFLAGGLWSWGPEPKGIGPPHWYSGPALTSLLTTRW